MTRNSNGALVESMAALRVTMAELARDAWAASV
jgi:hypothetical protein